MAVPPPILSLPLFADSDDDGDSVTSSASIRPITAKRVGERITAGFLDSALDEPPPLVRFGKKMRNTFWLVTAEALPARQCRVVAVSTGDGERLEALVSGIDRDDVEAHVIKDRLAVESDGGGLRLYVRG